MFIQCYIFKVNSRITCNKTKSHVTRKKKQVQVIHRTVVRKGNRILIQILYSLLEVSVLRDKDLEQFLDEYVLMFFGLKYKTDPPVLQPLF